ncbi:MAG: restriction endonuclease subunit S [Acidobacteria bacterium]|nr:restriction endonuclease subunit S [Acidobacteriota bacterium]
MTIINELPPNWEKESVLNLVDLINGYAFKPSDWSKEGLPIIRIQNLNDTNASFNFFNGTLPEKFLVKPGELLFAWSGTPGTSFGAHIWQGGEAWLNQHIFKVRFDEQDLDKQFLCFAINRNLDRYITAAHGGAGLAHITKGKFESSEVLIPPLAEQRRIVAEIEKQFARLEECTAALRRVAEDLKQYRASVLKAACEGRLVPTEAELARAEGRDYEPASVLLERILAERRARWEADQLVRMKAQGKALKDDKWKEKYEQPEEPAPGQMLELPEGWEWVSVEQLTENFDGQRIPVKSSRRAINRGNYAYYGASGVIDWVEDYIFDGDYLLIAEDGANLASRSTPIAFRASGKFWVNNHAHIVQTIGDVPLSFLEVYLNGKDLRFYLSGSAQPKLTQANLNRIIVPLPPLSEQHRIVAEVKRQLSVVDELEELVSINLERAGELRRSILKRAFEGRLVPQDPNDEPAAALLERIAAERQRRTEEAMTQKKSPSDKRRKKTPEAESATPLVAEERVASQPLELLTAFTANESLTVEDLFRHGGYSFDSEDDKDIDAFFENLTGELEAARLTLERKDNDDVVIRRGAV